MLGLAANHAGVCKLGLSIKLTSKALCTAYASLHNPLREDCQRFGSYLEEGWYGYDRRKYLEVPCKALQPCSWPLGPPTMRPDAPKTNPTSALHQLTLRSGRASRCKLEE